MTRISNTREKLIETAQELIWRESYNSVSVDDICKKAGVQKGSFYHYFPSKIDLAAATMTAFISEMKSAYDDMFSPARPALERLNLMAEHVVSVQKEVSERYGHICGCPFITLGSELAAQDGKIAGIISSTFDEKTAYYRSALKDLKDEGRLQDDIDIDEKSKEIFSFIIGQLTICRIRNDMSFLETSLKKSLHNLIGLK